MSHDTEKYLRAAKAAFGRWERAKEDGTSGEGALGDTIRSLLQLMSPTQPSSAPKRVFEELEGPDLEDLQDLVQRELETTSIGWTRATMQRVRAVLKKEKDRRDAVLDALHTSGGS